MAYTDIDRTRPERERGITINATHVEYETEKRHYTHIDCPGHQDYIKNMIVGTTQMEGVILVVSITDGPQEQTKEHLILAKEIGIKYLVCFVNKLDALVEKDMKDVIELEIREMLDVHGFDGFETPLICGSARKALEERKDWETEIGSGSVLKLMEVVDSYIPQPERPLKEPFFNACGRSLYYYWKRNSFSWKSRERNFKSKWRNWNFGC